MFGNHQRVLHCSVDTSAGSSGLANISINLLFVESRYEQMTEARGDTSRLPQAEQWPALLQEAERDGGTETR